MIPGDYYILAVRGESQIIYYVDVISSATGFLFTELIKQGYVLRQLSPSELEGYEQHEIHPLELEEGLDLHALLLTSYLHLN